MAGSLTSYLWRCRAWLMLPLVYAGTWWYLDPVALAHNRMRPFLLDATFTGRFARHAGGWLEYATSFLVQTYRIPSLGILVIVSLLGLHAVLFAHLLRRCGVRHTTPTALLMSLLLLLMFRHYITLVSVLAILLALAGASTCLAVPDRRPLLFFTTFLVLDILLLYATGGAAWFMATLVILHTALSRRRPGTSLALLAITCTIPPLLRWFVYEPSLVALCLRWLPMDPAVKQLAPEWIAFCLLYPASIVTAIVRARWILRHPAPSTRPRLLPGLTVAGFVLVLALMGILGSNHMIFDRLMQADRLAEQGQWEAALERLQGLPISGDLYRHNTIRCLAHTGRLLSELFQHPQEAGADIILLSNPEMDTLLRIARKRSDIYYELGFVNESERWTHEAFSDQGEVDYLLERLSMLNWIKGRPDASLVFLEAMAHNPFIRRHARALQARIRADPAGMGSAELARIRACIPTTDYAGPWRTDEMLQHALATNPRNRLAYDYLLTFYLLTKRHDDFAAWIGRYRDYYPTLPLHCEEACNAYRYRTGRLPPGMENWQASPTVTQRFSAFLATCRQSATTPRALWDALASDFGATFWFFDLTGRTAAGTPVSQEDLAGLAAILQNPGGKKP